MDHVPIFGKAWELATLSKYRKLLWFGFLPAFMATVVTTLVYSIRGYQYWEEFFGTKSMLDIVLELSGSTLGFLGSNAVLALITVVGVVLFAIGYFFLPVYFHGGLIKIIPEAIEGKEVRFRAGMVEGMKYFLPLFEYKALLSPFRLTWVFLTYWLIRTFMPEMISIVIIPLGLWFIVNLFVTVFFIFTEYFIVLEDERVIPAIGKSIHLVFINLEQVLHILFLILLIGVRVIFNTLITFGIPALIIFLGSLIASTIVSVVLSIIAVLLGVALLLLVSYINAIIDVFLTAAWALLFENYKKQLK